MSSLTPPTEEHHHAGSTFSPDDDPNLVAPPPVEAMGEATAFGRIAEGDPLPAAENVDAILAHVNWAEHHYAGALTAEAASPTADPAAAAFAVSAEEPLASATITPGEASMSGATPPADPTPLTLTAGDTPAPSSPAPANPEASARDSADGGGHETEGLTFGLEAEEPGPRSNSSRPSPTANLPADPKLLKLLVTPKEIQAVWAEIKQVEDQVVSLTQAASKLKGDMLDRLKAARNQLMSEPSMYEEAYRELGEVKLFVKRMQQSPRRSEQPNTIVAYLLLFLALLAASGLLLLWLSTNKLIPNPASIGPSLAMWLTTVMFGGFGGLTAALWNLGKHIDDYDPQFARWYYLSPVQGLIFGPVIVLFFQVGLPLALNTGAATGATLNPLVMYFLGWLVGFQQNLLLRLINVALKTIFPGSSENADQAKA
jgi:hypothetical protein